MWDFFFRAHARNLDLLRARATDRDVRGHWSDTLVVGGAILLLLVALAVPVVTAVWIWRALTHAGR